VAPDRTHFSTEEIAPGVHAALAAPEGFGLCNATVVDLGGTTLVFDAMLTPEAGLALRRAAERLTGRPVDLVVNSHYHGDHVRGNSALAPLRIVSTRKVRELILEVAPQHLAADKTEVVGELEGLRSGRIPATPGERRIYEAWYAGVLATPNDLVIRPPDLTFEHELSVHGSRREVRILSFGGGHSPSDVLAFLPEERIVLLGDLVSSGFHPCLWDGNTTELLRILAKVRELGPQVAVPGHGPVGGLGEIRAMEAYVRGLQARARKRQEEGVAPDQNDGESPPAPFDRWIFSSFYRQNLAFVQTTLSPPT
jgi:cyclase